MDGEGGVLPRAGKRRASAARRLLGSISEAWRERRVAQAESRPERPSPEPRVARSGLAVWVQARLAVRAGVRLEDFLRHRLARYAARLPVPLEALPARVDIEGDEPVVTARVPRAASITGPRLDRDSARETAAPAPAARAVAELRDGLDRVTAQLRAAREHEERTARALADDLASGALIPAPAVEASLEQLGRPPVPLPAPIHLLRGFALALLLAVAWRLAGPVLATAGLSPGELPAAFAQAPLPTALALVFALGGAAAIFAFLWVAIDRARQLAESAPEPGRRRFAAAGAAGAGLLAAAIAAASLAPVGVADAVLLLAVPLAAVLLLAEASRLAARRDAAAAAALAWDRERTREAVERARRAEGLATARAALEELEEARAELARRLAVEERRAAQAERRAAEAAAAEARRLERLTEALAGALELDRYAYLRLAAAGQLEALARPVRSERTPRLEPAVSAERFGVAG